MTTHPENKTAKQLFDEFEMEHNVKTSLLQAPESIALNWVLRAKHETENELTAIRPELEKNNEQAWKILQFMLNRVHERAKAAIIAFSLGLPESSDTIARTIAEASLDIIFIIMGEPTDRLSTYFAHYLHSEEKEIDNWVSLVQEKNLPTLDQVQKASENRLKMVELFRNYISSTSFSRPTTEKWPSARERFKSLGLEEDYLTVYAILSAQIHVDAEEVLRHFYAESTDIPNFSELMTRESRAFSRLLLLVSVSYYIKAVLMYSVYFELLKTKQMVNVGMQELEQEIHQARTRTTVGNF